MLFPWQCVGIMVLQSNSFVAPIHPHLNYGGLLFISGGYLHSSHGIPTKSCTWPCATEPPRQDSSNNTEVAGQLTLSWWVGICRNWTDDRPSQIQFIWKWHITKHNWKNVNGIFRLSVQQAGRQLPRMWTIDFRGHNRSQSGGGSRSCVLFCTQRMISSFALTKKYCQALKITSYFAQTLTTGASVRKTHFKNILTTFRAETWAF